jgi:hypothetical protein
LAACMPPADWKQPSTARSGARPGSRPGLDDSARIVYAAMIDNHAQIFSVQPDGERSIQLTAGPQYKCRPVWSPSHKRIAYFRFSGDRPVGDWVDLEIMNENGSEPHTLLTQRKVDLERTRASWSADETVIYLHELDFPTVLFGYAVADGHQVETVRLPKPTFLTQAHSVSPDGRWIAGAGPDPASGQMHIGLAARDGRQELDLLKPLRTPQAMSTGTVVWSYNSTLVAFELDNLILVARADSRQGYRVLPLEPQEVNAEITSPAFSPSGNKIACIQSKTKEGVVGTGDKETRTDVWVMRLDKTHPRQITQAGTCFDPHW